MGDNDLAKKAQEFNQTTGIQFYNHNKFGRQSPVNNASRDTMNSNYNRDQNLPKRHKFMDSSDNLIYKDKNDPPLSRLDKMYNAKKNEFLRQNSEAYETSVSNSTYNDKLMRDLNTMMNPRYIGQRKDPSLFE